MSTVIWHTMMSLDGFVAGPDDTMDWAFSHGGRSALADETRDSIGAILAGRRWYDVASAKYDGVARHLRRCLDRAGIRAHPSTR